MLNEVGVGWTYRVDAIGKLTSMGWGGGILANLGTVNVNSKLYYNSDDDDDTNLSILYRVLYLYSIQQ